MPFLARDSDLHGHAKYMLHSTFHWMPLINGYSDYIPPEFVDRAQVLRGFPSREAFQAAGRRPAAIRGLPSGVYRDPALLKQRLAGVLQLPQAAPHDRRGRAVRGAWSVRPR